MTAAAAARGEGPRARSLDQAKENAMGIETTQICAVTRREVLQTAAWVGAGVFATSLEVTQPWHGRSKQRPPAIAATRSACLRPHRLKGSDRLPRLTTTTTTQAR
jgi:hypothetical protein